MVTLRVSMPAYLFNGREPTMNHDKMMNAIHEIFDPALPRLAPGDDAVTRRALDLLFNGGLGRLSSDFRVLDVGCGNGSQTLCLARELGCRVTALDNHQPYLDELQRRAQAEELSHLIQLLCADMNTLGDGEGEYDLVWAEGSAFVMGISQALRAWRTQLVPGGALGFTDLVWLQDESEEFSDTDAFLERRIDDVMKIEKVKAKLRDKTGDLPDIARFLGKLRYPEARR